MSLRAMVWALEDSPVDCPVCVLVLSGLANHVDEQLVAFPSVATLARYARTSRRTVHRHLRDLEDAGLIRRSWTKRLEQLPADRRPTAYQLLPRGDSLSPRGSDGVTTTTRRGDNDDTTGCQAVTRTAQEPPNNQGRRGDTHVTPSHQGGVVPGEGHPTHPTHYIDDHGRSWVTP